MTDTELDDIRRIAQLPYPWERLNNKTIFISGGTGFIGTFLINVLRYRAQKYGFKVKIISLSRSGGKSDEILQCLQGDVTNPVNYSGKVDYVLHLASNTHPKQYAEDPIGTIMTNILGCANLLKLATDKRARFLLASSVEIYGQGTKEPMNEKYCGYIDCNLARAGYNEAKRTCEALTQSYRQKYKTDAVIVRLARVFGADKKNDTKALSQFMEKAIRGEKIVLESNGKQRFSYCYVADAVSGILKALLEGHDGEAYNVAEDYEGMTLGDYAAYIAKMANQTVTFDIEENTSASRATFALLDTSKIKALGWKPEYTVCSGLERTYEIKKKCYQAE